MKYRSQIYNINRNRPRHGYRYTKYKMYLSIVMLICIKQHTGPPYSCKFAAYFKDISKNTSVRLLLQVIVISL